jgi:hypothetical protein
MSKLVLSGDTSGSVTLDAPAVSGTTTLTLPTTSGTVLTNNNATVGSSGIQFSDASTQTAAASPYVLKNRIINGAMQIAQRATSATNVGTSSATSYNTVDRFQIYRDGAATGCNPSQQSTGGPTGLPYFIRIQRVSGNTATNALNIAQSIESINCYDLAGQSVTLSFWARAGSNYSSTSNQLAATIVSGTGTNGNIYSGLTGFATTATTTITLTTSWQRFTLTGTVASNANQVGILIQSTPTGTAGTNDFYDITGVQLEQNTSATPFERRLYNQELANCQRYYETSYSQGTAIATSTIASATLGVGGSVNDIAVSGVFKVTKRASPTVTLYSPATGTSGAVRNYNTGADVTSSLVETGDSQFRVYKTSGFTSGSFYGFQWTSSVEL